MNTIKITLIIVFCCLTFTAFSQNMPATQGISQELADAMRQDDAKAFDALITKDNINDCYGDYSLLSETVRLNAKKCFDLLISKGANVNQSCNGYVTPLMHAAKYGRLDMVKALVAKGANITYTYHGSYKPADGQTPVTYAEKYQHPDIAIYLRSIATNQ